MEGRKKESRERRLRRRGILGRVGRVVVMLDVMERGSLLLGLYKF